MFSASEIVNDNPVSPTLAQELWSVILDVIVGFELTKIPWVAKEVLLLASVEVA